LPLTAEAQPARKVPCVGDVTSAGRSITARCYDRRMPAKVPWLPSVLPPGARPERCPRCGRMALIPWTLRRDNATKAILRTWVCTECQTLVERPEPE